LNQTRPSRTVAGVKVRDVVWRIKLDGWRLVAQRGSHRQFKHPTKPGKVTIAGSASDELHPKTAASFFRQAGLWREERET
jgi:predicted RNA binding protein YcfA (HicA-like mRNA interferase family)